MKNLLFIIGIICLSSSFTTSKNSNEKVIVQQQESLKKGYVIVQGRFQEIDLYFVPSEAGYMVFSRWTMRESPGYNLPTRGDGYNKRSIPLNSQNQYAIQYNFTHYVDTYYGAAYFNAAN